MRKLITGLHQFHSVIFRKQKELFDKLSQGQAPEVLFITCSDSRINPNLITQTEPGDLFILRNAGNLVPPYGSSNGGEGATIEMAVSGLGVKDIIICGHSLCGAMKALFHPEEIAHMPTLQHWLSHAESTRRIGREKYGELADADLLNIATQENVLVQLEHLRTHPAVASSLAQGKLNLHGWIYKIETGQIFGYNPAEGQFLPLEDLPTTMEWRHSRLATESLL